MMFSIISGSPGLQPTAETSSGNTSTTIPTPSNSLLIHHMLTFSGPVTYRTPQVLTLNHYSSGPAYILPIYQPVYLPKYHPRYLAIAPFTKGLISRVTHCMHGYLLLLYDIWIISLGPLMDQTNARQPPSSLYRI